MRKTGFSRYAEAFGITLAVHLTGFLLLAALGYIWPGPTDDIIEVTLAAGVVRQEQIPQPQQPQHQPQPQPKQVLEEEGIKKEVKEVPQTAPPVKQEAGKIGDGGQDDVTSMPKILKQVKPDYPPAARNMDKQGRVLVELLISSRGVVEQAIIVQSGGFAALDEAVLKAVYKWRFAAAKNRYGRPCACKVVIPIKFQLK